MNISWEVPSTVKSVTVYIPSLDYRADFNSFESTVAVNTSLAGTFLVQLEPRGLPIVSIFLTVLPGRKSIEEYLR